MVHTWISGSSGSTIHNAAFSHRDNLPAKREAARFRHHWRAARGLFFIFSFLVLFSGLALMHTRASGSADGAPATGEIVVTADGGDTLWDIAKAYKKPSIDTRAAVFALKKRNDLSNSELQVGQEIIVPARLLP